MYKIGLYALFLALADFCLSQTVIHGKVYDIDAISGARVVLKDTTDKIISFTFTDNDGLFILNIDDNGTYHAEITALGYNVKKFDIDINNQKDINLTVQLKSEMIVLNEIIVEGKKEIMQKNDTVIFDVNSFALGNEEVVEDLLKRIPGLVIEQDGTVKVGNQEIEKIMVEGDDFFEKGYKILSKNMPANPIDRIELLQNYSNNAMLKGIEDSNRVALNLKLKEDAKRIWFGNMTLGYDPFSEKNRHLLKGNLMNFGLKSKFYFLTNSNNIGYDATGDIKKFISPKHFDEPASIGDDQTIYPIINTTTRVPFLDPSRAKFNNDKMISLNAIFNPIEKLKIKTIGLLNHDKFEFFRNREDNILTSNLAFTNSEKFHLQSNNRTGVGKIDLTYNLSKSQMLEATTIYQLSKLSNVSNLRFNDLNTFANLENPNRLFDQNISYTHKLNDLKVILVTARLINQKLPENFSVNNFEFQDLFGNIQANNLNQDLTQNMTFVGFEAHLLERKKNKNLLEVKMGYSFRNNLVQSQLNLISNENTIDQPEAYQNDLSYKVNELYANGKYEVNINSVSLIGNLSIHQLFNTYHQKTYTQRQQPFFIKPRVGVEWRINSKNLLRTNYEYSINNIDVLNLYNNYILKDYRKFKKGTGQLNQLDASTFLINYQLGNWTDRFFVNANFVYTQNHDYISTNSIIQQDFTQSESLVIKDRNMIVANATMDYFIKKIDGNVKLKFNYAQTEFENYINNTDLRIVKSKNYNYGFEYKTTFDGIFNFHLGSQWQTSQIKAIVQNQFTDNQSFLDINFVFSKKLHLDVGIDRYYFGNLDREKTYYFIDVNAKYTIKENKLDLYFSGKNLSNISTFRNYNISDIGTSITEYRLIPRLLMLKLEYKF